MKLNDLKIGTRLNLGFAMVLALMLVISGFTYLRLLQTQAGIDSSQGLDGRVTAATEWLGASRLNMARVLAIAKSDAHPEVASYFEPLIAETTRKISDLQKELQAGTATDGGSALMADITRKRNLFVAARQDVLAALHARNKELATGLIGTKLMPASESYLAAIAEFKRHTEELVARNAGITADDIRSAKLILWVLTTAGVGLGLAVAFAMKRSVMLPLQTAAAATRTIAGSDLSQAIPAGGADELGDLLRGLGAMQGTLRELVTEVRDSTDSIGTVSSEIASGNRDLSSRTEQAASNLQQTASSMEQLTGTVRQSADSARQANQLATSAAQVAARGGQVVARVVSTMNDINASSQKIADIIGVIDGIAFQTNILALNAAVEAARAGEQGRGFAVVAGEVRSLAQRSAEAAKEIKSLIGASVEKVEGGSRLVADAGQTMNEIVSSVQRVSDMIGEITTASKEQGDGIHRINGSVNHLDQMTQKNASLVEQSAAAADSLKAHAGRLASVVGTFRLEPGRAGTQRPDARLDPSD